MHASLALTEQKDGQTLRVPLFESVMTGFDDDRRHVVIDCGPARSGLLELLAGLRCRIDVLDLPVQLNRLASLDADSDFEAWFAQWLPAADDEPADLILCWNLLDYLEPAQIAALMTVLIERLRPGGRIHALVEYSSPKMAAAPGGMAPAGKTALTLESVAERSRPAPRHSRGALEKLMPGLKTERGMLLSNGMQEYLFRRPA